MPPFGPLSQRDLVRYLRKTGFTGPVRRGKHPVMQRGDITITIPNPHRGAIDRGLLARVLRQAGISREEWEAL